MKNIIVKAAFIAITFLLPLVTYAGPGFDPNVDDGCDVPLDGGLSILAVAGIGYAAKKVMAKKKSEDAAIEK
ncbi:MAG TPA: hypothetical protein PLQ78_06755 [Flavipsychrobacter sp.]|mgnify:CR=1 FL=1|jgi:hypothetical protein|nr:hypothetical protein [Flavipsychrobacter sp.]